MVNFRKLTLSSGREILGGRNSENNDELVSQAGKNDIILHTAAPGSPFVNVGEKPSKEDMTESFVFCAKYSQDWRDRKTDVVVNKFLRGDMNKSPDMKSGTWGVKKQKKVKVKKGDILKFEEGIRNETD